MPGNVFVSFQSFRGQTPRVLRRSEPIKRSACVGLVLCLSLLGRAEDGLSDKIEAALKSTPHPATASDFSPAPHLPCLNQGQTLVCWSYATSSFAESEMARLNLDPVRLSVMFTVYCQYLEKARQFVRTKGASRFSPGDLFTGWMDVSQQYGTLPATAYDRQSDGHTLDQHPMYSELEDCVQALRREANWNEARALSRVRKILNRHLGEPPRRFVFNGKSCTPTSFLADAVKLPWNDYIMITSFESAPFNTFTEFKVPDNWRHNTNYFNVPLPLFYESLKHAVRNGFSVAVSVDNTEPSYKSTGRYCLIPDFDIPAGGITQEARELRFQDGGTSDDHAIHIIGYKNFDGEDWFVAKDSWKTAWRDGNQGCLFLHSSYVKLKVLAFIVHRDGVPQVTALLP
jgi:bleomycin hydrolase